MPIYTYKCKTCKKKFDKYSTIQDYNKQTCCDEKCERIIHPPSHGKILEYFDEQLNCKITGPKQKSRILKENHLEEVGNG